MDKQINIKETLDWYIWAGVVETCADEVCLNTSSENTHFSLPQPTTAHTPAPVIEKNHIPSAPVRANVSLAAFDNIAKNARELCSKASSLEELKDLVQKFDGCNLKKTAANTVFGDGSSQARVLLIGEAPGADEDRIGSPFVGKCGKLLDKMLAAININRADCYITNVLPWRPPGNRTPTDEEIAICLPFLKRQIELIKPEFLLLLGGIALKSLLDVPDSISRTRGKWLEYVIDEQKTAQVLATYHPSYLLRSPSQKAKVWSDLLRLQKKMNNDE